MGPEFKKRRNCMEIDDFCVGKWNNYGSTMSVDGKYAQRLRDIDMANKIDRKKIR